VLEPLSVRHNAPDYLAWTSSIEHRADRAELDRPLYELVTAWLARHWPFTNPDYAPG